MSGITLFILYEHIINQIQTKSAISFLLSFVLNLKENIYA